MNTQLFKRAIPELINVFIYSVKNKKKTDFFIYFFQGVINRVGNILPRDCALVNEKIRKRLNYILKSNNSLLKSEIINFSDVDSLREVEVTVAGEKRRLCLENLWNIEHNDIEELYALHRFGWLLVAYVEGQLNWNEGFQYIIKWNVDHNIPGHGIGWGSYSIAERLSNWVIFLSVIDTQNGKF